MKLSLRLRLELKFLKIKVGSQTLYLELPPGMRNEKYDTEFLLLPELSQLIESERERTRAEDITWRLKVEECKVH
jgi:hypothetical protein